MPYLNSDCQEPIFVDLFVRDSYTEFHEYMKNCLVADAGSQADRHKDGRDLHIMLSF
jgi:hypothetical protein